jgi:hypothetical protein
MPNKLIFLAGFGVGYVLGARAGRQRYEQFLRATRRLKENPTVQETAGILQAQAGGLVSSAKETVTDKLSHTTWGSKVSHLLGDEAHHAQDARDFQAKAQAGSNGVPATTPRTEP